MHLFARKFLRWTNAHPPDRKIVRTMLRVAEWPALEWFMIETLKGNGIKAPNRIGQPYAWLVAVTVNQIHGIPADEMKPTLELLRGGRQMFSRNYEEHAAKKAAQGDDQ